MGKVPLILSLVCDAPAEGLVTRRASKFGMRVLD